MQKQNSLISDLMRRVVSALKILAPVVAMGDWRVMNAFNILLVKFKGAEISGTKFTQSTEDSLLDLREIIADFQIRFVNIGKKIEYKSDYPPEGIKAILNVCERAKGYGDELDQEINRIHNKYRR